VHSIAFSVLFLVVFHLQYNTVQDSIVDSIPYSVLFLIAFHFQYNTIQDSILDSIAYSILFLVPMATIQILVQLIVYDMVYLVLKSIAFCIQCIENSIGQYRNFLAGLYTNLLFPFPLFE